MFTSECIHLAMGLEILGSKGCGGPARLGWNVKGGISLTATLVMLNLWRGAVGEEVSGLATSLCFREFLQGPVIIYKI